MARFEFLRSFEIGVPVVDEDHRRLIGILNELDAAIQASEFGKCRNLFETFLEAARTHFAREEDVLRRAAFPGRVEHVAYHWNLIERATKVAALCERATAKEQLESCFLDMAEYFFDDILRGDLEFKSFLVEKGLAEN